jgi:hypothetical protein
VLARIPDVLARIPDVLAREKRSRSLDPNQLARVPGLLTRVPNPLARVPAPLALDPGALSREADSQTREVRDDPLMFVCDTLQTEIWYPNFSSSGQASPVWTRVRCGTQWIANALEWTEWMDNPVQVMLCDACGHDGCETGGYVHVSRLAGFVLWSPPQEQDWHDETQKLIRGRGALAIPSAVWDGWAAAIPNVPEAGRLPAANHTAVADAWITGPGRTSQTILDRLREKCAGGDTLGKDEAIALVERVLKTLRRRGDEPFEQPLLSPDSAGARLETLHFDGPRELDWPAFAFSGDETFIALDAQHIASPK